MRLQRKIENLSKFKKFHWKMSSSKERQKNTRQSTWSLRINSQKHMRSTYSFINRKRRSMKKLGKKRKYIWLKSLR